MFSDGDFDHLFPSVAVIEIGGVYDLCDQIVFGNFKFNIAVHGFVDERSKEHFSNPTATHLRGVGAQEGFWLSRGVDKKAFIDR